MTKNFCDVCGKELDVSGNYAHGMRGTSRITQDADNCINIDIEVYFSYRGRKVEHVCKECAIKIMDHWRQNSAASSGSMPGVVTDRSVYQGA